MRLKQGLLSKKEWESKKNLIKTNIDIIPDKEQEFKHKLGLDQYFMHKNSILQDHQYESAKIYGQDINKGSVTERHQRPKSQSLKIQQTQDQKIKHLNFINKIKKQDLKLKKLHEQHLQQEQDKLQKLSQQEQITKQKQEQQQELEKKQKYIQSLEQIQKVKKERQERLKDQDSQVKQLLKLQPLHIKMESQYQDQVEFPMLEEKKKKLEEIRQIFRQPLDKLDIIGHMKKYESEAEAKNQQRLQKKKQLLKEFSTRDQDIKYGRVIEEDLLKKEEEDQRNKERKQINERMQDYYDQVKDTIVINTSNVMPKTHLKGARSLKQLEAYNDSKPLQSHRGAATSRHSMEQLYTLNQSRSTNRQQQDIIWKSETTKLEQQKQKKIQLIDEAKQQVKSKEYLKSILLDIDKKKKVDETDITKYLDDQKISDRERFDLVHLRAKQIEKKAKLEEQLLLVDSNDPANIDKQNQVNELYIKSLQAKLKMLNAD